jgi:hypothetical protein
MCPDCLGANVAIRQFDWAEMHGEHGTESAFICQDCGWYGDADDFSVPCSECKCKVAWSKIELDGDCNVVCRECYLANPPQEDIDGEFHDAVAEMVN